MLDMATELRELRGLSKATQKQFEEQQKKVTGKHDDGPEPSMTMSQWKALLVSNKKEFSSKLLSIVLKSALMTKRSRDCRCWLLRRPSSVSALKPRRPAP